MDGQAQELAEQPREARRWTFFSRGSRGRLPDILSLILVLLSLGAILHTWTLYDQTWDEPYHIARGMEWLLHHTYSIDQIDPPLPPVMVALGPYAMGVGELTDYNPWKAGNAVLERGNYHHTLYAARAGTLVFFLFAAYLVWSRARVVLGRWGACLALLLFCFLPSVVAHSSLATTDASMFAMLFWAIDRLWRFLELGTGRAALMAGLSAGLAALCKMTAAPCLLIALGCFLVLRSYRRRQDGGRFKTLKSPSGLAVAFATCLLVIWGMYFFSVGTIAPRTSADREKLVTLMQRHHLPERTVLALMDHMPAPDYFLGLRHARSIAKHSGNGWILGKNRIGGTRWFFPVIFAAKMPIPFTLLFLLGFGLAATYVWSGEGVPYLGVLITGAAVPFAFGIASGVNLGSRHIFGMIPFAALLAAFGAQWLCRRGTAMRWVAVCLLAWFAVDAAWAARDPLPWYNELARRMPHGGAWFEPGSDFDWGQDLKRLPAVLAAHHVHEFAFAYSGSADLNRAGLPPWTVLRPSQRTVGWVVISGGTLAADSRYFGWLNEYRPVTRAGSTLLVYWIPPDPAAGGRQ
jgi:4-amino-4-deoxy-L-arabinose transferase-like glycosyltransferase